MYLLQLKINNFFLIKNEQYIYYSRMRIFILFLIFVK